MRGGQYQRRLITDFLPGATPGPAIMQTLFGDHEAKKKVKHPANGYAAMPGTGPAGETCRSCRHLVQNCYGFYKCKLMRRVWTNGYGTDVRVKSPACREWQTAQLTIEEVASGKA